MMRVALGVIAAVGIAAAVYATAGIGQNVLQKSERDELARVTRNDPHMIRAIRKARARLAEFLALARAPRPTITSMAVKIGVLDGEETEFFWITGFREKDGEFSGRISNTPRSVRNVREGDLVAFEEDDIVDWLYREGGKMVGNFTACALIAREPIRDQAAFKARYGLSCDF
jgi:uncharacterized protein YegJ (DUF2314 family)